MENRRQNALVTGSSSGMGKHTAIELAKLGYNVGITYRDEATYNDALAVYEECKKYGTDIQLYQVELIQRKSCEKLILDFLDHYKTIDVLVNNAGGALKIPRGEFDDLPLDYWDDQMALNLNAAAYLCHHAVKNMKENGIHGRIVNISSIHSKITWVKRKFIPYCAAKAGLNMLTSALGVEVAPYGIRVNCVAPGFIMTGLSARYTPEHTKAFTDHIPTGTLGTTDDIVPMILFLCDEKNTRFIVGQTFCVDGGQSVTGNIDAIKEDFEK
jgi:NAD(P)-dependent dehydrogenase (short-subunit alcohol dehydrogenase family)